jgi:hypothetical protein
VDDLTLHDPACGGHRHTDCRYRGALQDPRQAHRLVLLLSGVVVLPIAMNGTFAD